jgi:hypothetical protein
VLSFSATQGPLEKVIHRELVALLQEHALSYSSVTIVSREAILGLNSKEASSSPKDDCLDAVKEAIMLALSDESFSSVRFVWERVHNPQDMRAKKLHDLPFVGPSILCIS